MKELLYFSSSDLMVQVLYEKADNTLNYFTHRKLSFGERVIIEQYLLTNIAVKTEYYKKHPANFNYSGINNRLLKELNQFHLKNTMKTLKKKEKNVDESVKDLIGGSMETYYFEKIGSTILEIREIAEDPFRRSELDGYGNRLQKLIEAYNINSDKHVSVHEIVPSDLKSCLGFS